MRTETEIKEIRKLSDALEPYRARTEFSLSRTFESNILQARKNMRGTIELVKPSLKLYKRAVFNNIKFNKGYCMDLIDFDATDEELEQNRVSADRKPFGGFKLTKALHRIVDGYANLEVFIDYLNKPRYENKKYYLTSDPSIITEAYTKILTCISPRSGRSHLLYQILLSQYAYVAYDEDMENRILVYIDDEQKLVFLNPIYGKTDPMLPVALIHTLALEGYRFLSNVNFLFPDLHELLGYVDSKYTHFRGIIETFGEIIRNMETTELSDGTFYEYEVHNPEIRVRVFNEKPENANIEGDAITGDKLFNDTLLYEMEMENHPECEEYIIDRELAWDIAAEMGIEL